MGTNKYIEDFRRRSRGLPAQAAKPPGKSKAEAPPKAPSPQPDAGDKK